MFSFTRLPKFLMICGVTLIILSYTSPIVQTSYTAIFELSYGTYDGIMVNCYSNIDIRIESGNNEAFSTFFMDSTNGLLAIKEGSLENVTLMESFINKTIVYAHLSIPVQGWYSILVTPSVEGSIEFIRIEFVRENPNPRLLFVGGLLVILSMPWILKMVRTRSLAKKHEEYNKSLINNNL